MFFKSHDVKGTRGAQTAAEILSGKLKAANFVWLRRLRAPAALRTAAATA